MRALGRAALGVGALLAMLTIAGCGTSSAGTTGAARSGASSGVPSSGSLVGTWTTTVTKADLAAGGMTDPGLQDENSGTFRWTFDPAGSWTEVQQSLDGSPIRNPVFRGTYVVQGGTLIATTNFPTEFKDAGLHYTWSISGSELRLVVLDPPDPSVSLITESHPWTRVP